MRLILILYLSINISGYGQKASIDNPLKTIDSITLDMKVSKGLITTYQNKKNELYNTP